MTELTREGLYAAYQEKVLAYLRGKLETREDAEDLCADVFEQVFRSLPRYDPGKASLSTWIYQITRFTLIDFIRRKRPREPLSEDIAAADDLEQTIIQKETLEQLAAALTALEPKLRDVIILRYYRGHTLTDIARMTGQSYGMVKVYHKKALERLRQGMK